MATVSIVKATYSDPEIETLLAPIGGMEQFVKKNEKVLLKVNLLSGKGPEKAVTTHPEFVRAVAKAARKAGGDPVKMDLVLASTDHVAMDIAVCKILESSPWAYRHLKWLKFAVCGLRGLTIRSMDPRMLPIKDSDYQTRPIIS